MESLDDQLPNIFYSIIFEGNLIGQLGRGQMSMKAHLAMLKLKMAHHNMTEYVNMTRAGGGYTPVVH